MLPLYDSIPTRRFPVVTVALIAANAAVWLLYQVPSLERSVYDLGFIPCEVDGACADQGLVWPINVFTSMFSHGSWAHILGNLLLPIAVGKEHNRHPIAAARILQQAELLTGEFCSVILSPAALAPWNGLE